MNPLTAHYKDGAVGSLNGLSALVFFGFPRIAFPSLGTSDLGLVIQPDMFYSFFDVKWHQIVRSTGEGMALSGISSEGVKMAC